MFIALGFTWLYYHQGMLNPKNNLIKSDLDSDIRDIF